MKVVEFLDMAAQCTTQKAADTALWLFKEGLEKAFRSYRICWEMNDRASLPMKKAPELLAVFGAQISDDHILSFTATLSAGKLNILTRLCERGFDLVSNTNAWRPVNKYGLDLGVSIDAELDETLASMMGRAVHAAKQIQHRLMKSAGVAPDKIDRLIAACWQGH